MKIKSLCLELCTPARISLSENKIPSLDLILTSDTTSVPQFPPWPTCADLLVKADTRELLGLSYYVGEYDELVRSMVNGMDMNVVSYVKNSSQGNSEYYSRFFEIKPNHLEIKWSPKTPTRIELAQLDSDLWYYETKSNVLKPVIIGLNLRFF